MSETMELLKSARHASDAAETWADLSNALFDQRDGLISKAFRTREEREAFVKSPEYRKLRELVEQNQTRTGLVQGAAPTKSGKLLVRLPKTMHAALESEAEHEGVSLNQLVLTKLALQLSSMRARRGDDPL